jgi:PAS domain-containing protein
MAMLEVGVADLLLGNSHLAVSLVRPSGDILYENRLAREMMGRTGASHISIAQSFTIPQSWTEILEKLDQNNQIEDEPVLLQTLHGDAELCYLTIIPQHNTEGGREALLCLWAVRRKAISSTSQATDTGTLSEYTRELEELLEHRTYQNLLAAEQNESARDALDLLTVGVLIAACDGSLHYRNRAVADDFGVKPANYLQPSISHILEPTAAEAFREVVAPGLRRCIVGHDPAGAPAVMDMLPLIRAGQVQRVIVQFSRLSQGETHA